MLVNCFVLSTPDLNVNPLVDWLALELGWPVHSEQSKMMPSDDSVNGIHRQILKRLQKNWYEELDTTSLLDQASQFQNEIDTSTNHLVANNCFIHDPLLCRFLPLWKEKGKGESAVDSSQTLSTKVLFHYSDPLECAVSLQRAWRMPIAVGLALWESYVIDACKNLSEHDYVLISSQEITYSGTGSLTSLLKWVSGASHSQESVGRLMWPSLNEVSSIKPINAEHLSSCLQDSQIEILDLLGRNEIDEIAQRDLSFFAADTLEYYGQLRGGLEHANSSLSSLKSKYADLQAQHREVQKSHTQLQTQAQATHHQQASDASEDDTIEQKGAVTPLTSQQAATELCNVKVQIEGMNTIEFLSPVDSPVLEMLKTHIAGGLQDELIFLNYGETGNEALYFMSSSLMALETERA